jgi:hypothetical protein
MLFVHAGINPHQPLLPIEVINAKMQKIMSGPEARMDNYANAEDGPLWYRGLALNDAAVELEPLIRMMEYYDVKHIVIAHTPTGGNIVARFDGRVIRVDVGISKFYGSNTANLLAEGQKLFSVTPEGTTLLLE